MRFFVLGLWSAIAALAQAPVARLEGTIEDPSGAAVAGARVTVVNEMMGFSTSLLSDQQGLYVFPAMPPGNYSVRVEASGFQKAVLNGIALNVSTTVTAPVRLEFGPTTETINVEAKEAAVQVADPQGGGVVALRDIQLLPQAERNPIKLAIFQPGVQVMPGPIGFSNVNGARIGSNEIKLDGLDMNEPMYPALGFANRLPSDLVEEFRVITYSGKAEYGRSSGAQIEMISRSGTNQFHGGLFEFFRNTALNANDFFNNRDGIGRPKLVYNGFGATFGGPVRRDRTFFFASYQGDRAARQAVRNRMVLTEAAKSGIFRWPEGTGLQSFDIVRNDPRRLGIDPMVAGALRLLPAPNNFDIGDQWNTAGFRFNNPRGGRVDTYMARIDHRLTNTVNLFFRPIVTHASNIDDGGDAPF